MIPRPLLTALASGFLAASMLAPHVQAQDKSGRDQVVGTDPAGDWGTNQLPATASPVGEVLGQDLIKASISLANKETIEFTFTLTSLPALGGVPEFSRYAWEFEVDGGFFIIDGKFTNYSRGTCDPFSGACPPPRDPGLYPFFVFDGCSPGIYWAECHEVGLVHASFDPSAGTITVPVPLSMIDATPGSKLTAGAGPFWDAYGGNVIAAPAAWRTIGGFPVDALRVKRAFRIPRT